MAAAVTVQAIAAVQAGSAQPSASQGQRGACTARPPAHWSAAPTRQPFGYRRPRPLRHARITVQNEHADRHHIGSLIAERGDDWRQLTVYSVRAVAGFIASWRNLASARPNASHSNGRPSTTTGCRPPGSRSQPVSAEIRSSKLASQNRHPPLSRESAPRRPR